MLVDSVVNKNVPTVHPEDDVESAVGRLLDCRIGILPVVAEDGRGARVVGLLRFRDAFTATYGRGEPAALPVAAAMSPVASTCRASDSLGIALRTLRRSGIDALPVLDGEGYLVGVLSFADLVRATARRSPPT
jgi:CBS-domain-containing membrane protein